MEKPDRPVNPENGAELFDEEFPVMSNTECTGMTPTPPQDDFEVESYSQIYDIPVTHSEQQGLRREEGVHNPLDAE